MNGSAAHDDWKIDPPGNCQVCPASAFRSPERNDAPLPNVNPTPHGRRLPIDRRREIGPRESHLEFRQGFQFRADEGRLDGRLSLPVSDQQVGRPQGETVHGPGNGNPVFLVPVPAQILNGRESARLNYLKSIHKNL